MRRTLLSLVLLMVIMALIVALGVMASGFVPLTS